MTRRYSVLFRTTDFENCADAHVSVYWDGVSKLELVKGALKALANLFETTDLEYTGTRKVAVNSEVGRFEYVLTGYSCDEGGYYHPF